MREAQQVIDGTAEISRLLQLDEVWTAAVVRGLQSDGSRDRDDLANQLQKMHDDMRHTLRRSRRLAARISDIATRHFAEAQDTLDGLLWDDSLVPNDREALRWWTARHGGLSGMVDQVATLPQMADQEISGLARQLEIVMSGEPASGDLSKSFRCGSAQGLLVGGILALPAAPATGIGLAVASGVVAGAAVASTTGVGALLIIAAALFWAKRYHC